MKNLRGFTLVELIITLAVGAILMSWAAPSFNSIIRNSRLTTTTNEFITALSLARSEAIRRGTQINVAAISNDWDNGWTVTINGGATLRTFSAPSNAITIGGDTTSIGYSSTGLTSDYATTAIHNFTVCDSGDYGRQVRIATGRPSIASKTAC